MRVLAVDPGEKVGWATATVSDVGWLDQRPGQYVTGADAHDCRNVTPGKALKVTGHGISYLKDAALQIHRAVVVEDRIDVVVFETFILTHRGAKVMVGSDLQTAQLVGMVRLAAWLNPRVQLVPQGPAAMASARKSMRAHPSGADIQERLAKLPKSHDESHDGSALLHAWTWFFERYV